MASANEAREVGLSAAAATTTTTTTIARCNRFRDEWTTSYAPMSGSDVNRINPVPITTGTDIATCAPGAVRPVPFVDDALRRMNYYRYLAGLAPATLSAEHQRSSEQCALMMAMNVNPDSPRYVPSADPHTQHAGWSCLTADGAEAARLGNIYAGQSIEDLAYLWQTTPAHIVRGFVDDFGSSKQGHRQNVLCPDLDAVSFGHVCYRDGARHFCGGCQWAYGRTPRGLPPHGYVAWPPNGSVPRQLVVEHPFYYWTFAAPGLGDAPSVRVNGAVVETDRLTALCTEDALQWLHFQLPASVPLVPFADVHVEVRGANGARWSYAVTPVDCDQVPAATASPSAAPTASPTTAPVTRAPSAAPSRQPTASPTPPLPSAMPSAMPPSAAPTTTTPTTTTTAMTSTERPPPPLPPSTFTTAPVQGGGGTTGGGDGGDSNGLLAVSAATLVFAACVACMLAAMCVAALVWCCKVDEPALPRRLSQRERATMWHRFAESSSAVPAVLPAQGVELRAMSPPHADSFEKWLVRRYRSDPRFAERLQRVCCQLAAAGDGDIAVPRASSSSNNSSDMDDDGNNDAIAFERSLPSTRQHRRQRWHDHRHDNRRYHSRHRPRSGHHSRQRADDDNDDDDDAQSV